MRPRPNTHLRRSVYSRSGKFEIQYEVRKQQRGDGDVWVVLGVGLGVLCIVALVLVYLGVV